MSKYTPVPNVVQSDSEEPVPAAIIAQSIVKIDKAMKDLLASGLKRETIVVLIAAASPCIGKPAIREVLNSLESLKKTYCN